MTAGDPPASLMDLVRAIRAEGVTDERVLEAMRRVDRRLFVPEEHLAQAYDNIPLPIGYGQTISQPLVVGLMTQALEVTSQSKVLEVGTGSGYQAAVLAELAKEVITVERIPALAQRARELLQRLGYTNVQVHVGSGTSGWPQDAPYDRIVVAAGAPRIPIHLVARLTRGGRLVVPVGSQHEQRLIVIEKGQGGIVEHDLGPVRFVPLIGEGAWGQE